MAMPAIAPPERLPDDWLEAAAVGDATTLVEPDDAEAGVVITLRELSAPLVLDNIELVKKLLVLAVDDVIGIVVMTLPAAMLMTCVEFEQSQPQHP
jgi:hypothetical protein